MTLSFHHELAADDSVAGRVGAALACTRALDTATVVAASGLIVPALANVARLTHDKDGNGLGLLIEEARTNIAINSAFAANWTAGAVGVLNANAATAPDGNMTAAQIIDNNAGGTGSSVYATQSITFSTSTSYIASCFVEAEGLAWARLSVANMGALALFQDYDLTNGLVGASPGANVAESGIVEFAGNRFLIWFRFTSDGSDTGAAFRVQAATGDGDITVDLDGTSSIRAWGPSMSVGGGVLSHIPTGGTSVLRNKDIITAADVAWLGAANTKYIKFRTGHISQNTTVWSLHDGTANERIALEITSGDLHFIGVDGGVTQWDISVAVAANTEYEVAVAWAAGDAEMAVDGTQIGTDASATLPTVTTYSLGSDHAGLELLNGTVSAIRNYDERLDAATVLAMSQGSFPSEGGGGPALINLLRRRRGR